MGKGAQFEDRASRGGAVASTSQPGMSPPSAFSADPAFEGKNPAGSRALGVNSAYDVTLTNGRTGGGVDARDRAALAEARLLETQQVLVQERLQREVAESILAETAKALSAVRRAAADGGAGAFAKDGVSLRGGGDEVNAMLNERFSLLKKEYDALRLESASKEVALAKANDEIATKESLALDADAQALHMRVHLLQDGRHRVTSTQHALAAGAVLRYDAHLTTAIAAAAAAAAAFVGRRERQDEKLLQHASVRRAR